MIKHFPLKNHKFALEAAKAALAANMQGKFWDFHHEALKNHKDLNEQKIQAIAREVGLDMEKFGADRNSIDVAKIIRDDLMNAKKIGIQRVPTVLINGKFVKKQDLAGISEMIEAELKK